MARLVRHEEMGPYEIPEGTELPVWVCGCGLSKNKPFCDGSHQKCRDERQGETYNYGGTNAAGPGAGDRVIVPK